MKRIELWSFPGNVKGFKIGSAGSPISLRNLIIHAQALGYKNIHIKVGNQYFKNLPRPKTKKHVESVAG